MGKFLTSLPPIPSHSTIFIITRYIIHTRKYTYILAVQQVNIPCNACTHTYQSDTEHLYHCSKHIQTTILCLQSLNSKAVSGHYLYFLLKTVALSYLKHNINENTEFCIQLLLLSVSVLFIYVSFYTGSSFFINE